ncbi:MAG: flagellar hook-length control protein FliK, partial [Rubrivivax sp.]|nr:flagellar hook-length control protein FliK [Rubrivivax sp.]
GAARGGADAGRPFAAPPPADALPATSAPPDTARAVATPAVQEAARAPLHEAFVSAALDTPEFAPALGQQITLLVRDGVQEARLNLHPQELGPVTVQIALEGSAAHVTLAAEQPATRQALEQSLPTLAVALREQGLTLAGGGVFEQPRDPGRGAEGPGRARDADRDAGDGALAATPVQAAPRRLRGTIDVYA